MRLLWKTHKSKQIVFLGYPHGLKKMPSTSESSRLAIVETTKLNAAKNEVDLSSVVVSVGYK
jgi:hypothetical protein